MYKYSILYLYFGTYSISISISTALLLWRQRKIRTSLKTLFSKKTAIWRLKKSQSNDKLLEEITSSSYHMEQKTNVEGSCIYNIHTGEKKLQLLLLKVCESFRFAQIKKLEVYFGLCESSLTLWWREDRINTVYVK